MLNIDSISRPLSLARLRAVHLRPYYSMALYRLVPVETDLIPTMGVDRWWRLYYNPGFVEKHSVLQNATVLIHEIEHLLRNHAHRCQSRRFDWELFNIAGDLEINDGLRAQRDLELPPGIVEPKQFRYPDNLTAEEYYAMLLRGQERLRELLERMGLSRPQCGSGAHGKQQPHEFGPPGPGGVRGVSAEEGDLVRQKVAEDIKDYAGKHPGTVPGSITRWAEEILNPKVPWQRELKGAVRCIWAKAAGMSDFSFLRPSRRQGIVEDVMLPALVDPTPKVAVVIDTSGSINNEQLAQALAEVRGVLRAADGNEGVMVLSVDAAVQTVKQVFDPRNIQLMGGGGTDMGQGIDRAAALMPRPDFVIVLTDGYTPWPAAPPKGLKVIVVLLGDAAPDGPSWARIIRVPSPGRTNRPVRALIGAESFAVSG